MSVDSEDGSTAVPSIVGLPYVASKLGCGADKCCADSVCSAGLTAYCIDGIA